MPPLQPLSFLLNWQPSERCCVASTVVVNTFRFRAIVLSLSIRRGKHATRLTAPRPEESRVTPSQGDPYPSRPTRASIKKPPPANSHFSSSPSSSSASASWTKLLPEEMKHEENRCAISCAPSLRLIVQPPRSAFQQMAVSPWLTWLASACASVVSVFTTKASLSLC